MLFGWIIRPWAFVVNAGVALLLAQQSPLFSRQDARPKSGAFDGYRGNVLAGLSRVQADLRKNGDLLLPARPAGHAPPVPVSKRRTHPT
jgi:hypothetical protein